jgi:hypothetical protein
MQVVVNHAIVVIPEEKEWALDAPQHPARQPQRGADSQKLLNGSINFRSRLYNETGRVEVN